MLESVGSAAQDSLDLRPKLGCQDGVGTRDVEPAGDVVGHRGVGFPFCPARFGHCLRNRCLPHRPAGDSQATGNSGVVAESAEVIRGGPVTGRFENEPAIGGDMVDVRPVRKVASCVNRPTGKDLIEPVRDADWLVHARDALVEVTDNHRRDSVVELGQKAL